MRVAVVVSHVVSYGGAGNCRGSDNGGGLNGVRAVVVAAGVVAGSSVVTATGRRFGRPAEAGQKHAADEVRRALRIEWELPCNPTFHPRPRSC